MSVLAATSLQSSVAATANRVAAAARTKVNYRCKQKQYFSVMWSLQFLLALLRHRPTHCSGEKLPRLVPLSAQAPHRNSSSTSGSGRDSPIQDAVSALCAASEGVTASLDVHGPLSAEQLRSLQHSFTNDQVRELCVRCMRTFFTERHRPEPPLSSCQFNESNVFAALTGLMRRLWPTERFRRHYITALETAHNNRVDHSELLATPGYLQEAGLHARAVFAGRLDASSCEASVFTTDTEREAAEAWTALIDRYTAFLPDRSHIHELENLPQEIAIGELLRDAVDCVRSAQASSTAAAPFALVCVVDVGGGNGFLAAQVAERLGCDGVVVDPFFPAHAIDCCPRLWPDTAHRTRPATRRQRTLHRTAALFRDVSWSAAVPAAPSRTALIAKHLCGSGVDEVLRRLDEQACLPRILVLAPCCFPRCSLDTYIDADFMEGLLGLKDADAFAHMTRLTDWNASVYQRLQDGATGDGPAASQPSSKKSVRFLVSCPEGVAGAVEAVVNQGRVQWLQRHGYVVRLVEYVPDCVTPKNRCLVAYQP